MKEFNWVEQKRLRKQIETALAQIGQENGITFELGMIHFDKQQLSARLTARTRGNIANMTNHSWERSCTDKQRHGDETTARLAAQATIRKSIDPNRHMWVYECKGCRGWHTTAHPGGDCRDESVTAEELFVKPATVQL